MSGSGFGGWRSHSGSSAIFAGAGGVGAEEMSKVTDSVNVDELWVNCMWYAIDGAYCASG